MVYIVNKSYGMPKYLHILENTYFSNDSKYLTMIDAAGDKQVDYTLQYQ